MLDNLSTTTLPLVLGCVLGVGCSSESGGPGSGANVGIDGGGDGASSSAPATVAGTITLPADATGRCIMVALDNDTTGSNGAARRGDGSYLLAYQLVAGRSAKFSFDAVPAGEYFLWAYVDVDSSASSPPADCEIQGAPNSKDHLGYFGTGMSPPGAPNARVPDTGSGYDFQIAVFP